MYFVIKHPIYPEFGTKLGQRSMSNRTFKQKWKKLVHLPDQYESICSELSKFMAKSKQTDTKERTNTIYTDLLALVENIVAKGEFAFVSIFSKSSAAKASESVKTILLGFCQKLHLGPYYLQVEQ